MSRINFHSMQILASISTSGSMARAASEMHMTPSAVSKRIAELEARFGTPLLMRHNSGVKLTSAGEIVVRYTEELMSRVSDMSQEIEELLDRQKGEIRVMSNTTGILLGLLEDITRFRTAHPGIRIIVSEGTSHEVVTAVRGNEVDIGVCVNTGRLMGLTSRAYRQTELAVVMPITHPMAGRQELSIEELANDHIIWSPPIHLANSTSPLPTTGDLELSVRSFDVILCSVSEQAGIAVVPFAALPGVLPPNLAVAHLKLQPSQFEIVMCYDSSAHSNAQSYQLIAWLESRSCLNESAK